MGMNRPNVTGSEGKPRGKVFDEIQDSTVHPTGWQILVKLDEVVKETDWGFVTATDTEHKREQVGQDSGIVKELGPFIFLEYEGIGSNPEERAAKFGYKVGDRVLFKRYEGSQPRVDGYDNYRLVDANCIIGRVESKHE